MSHRTEMQDDGKFRIWSTITDSYIIRDASEDELIDWYIEKAVEETRRDIKERVSKARKNGPVPEEQESE